MVRKNIIVGLCMSTLVACSAETIPSKPVYQPAIHPIQASTNNVNLSKKFDRGGRVRITEITSVNDLITAKSDRLYQNKHGDLVFSQNTILKFKCGNGTHINLIEVNGNAVSVPVALQNKDLVSTGCEKRNGAIKFVKFLK